MNPDEEPNEGQMMDEEDEMGGEEEGAGDEYDQYFDDQADIGYLPADHVSFLTAALNGQVAKCVD
jgi:hypothetical protein